MFKIDQHPCFSSKAHKNFGRLHLPVASRCNIDCNYCGRRGRGKSCVNEGFPGESDYLLSPQEASSFAYKTIKKDTRIKVIGIAGPGEPLYNPSTFETFKIIKRDFPHLTTCLSTNGLLLSEKLEMLLDLGIKTITITINAVRPEIGKSIYSYIYYKNKIIHGIKGAEILLKNQLEGLKRAVENQLLVKVNCVLIPSVNQEHILELAYTVKELGAFKLNIMPLIPRHKFSNLTRPSFEEVNRQRDICESIIPQIRHCRQCRADAVGLL